MIGPSLGDLGQVGASNLVLDRRTFKLHPHGFTLLRGSKIGISGNHWRDPGNPSASREKEAKPRAWVIWDRQFQGISGA